MKRVIPIISSLFFASMAFAQTIVPAGMVSGTWTKSGSPYLVQGNILITNGATLTIQPGVTVNFQGGYKLLVSGRLLAAGTVADTIRFTTVNTTTGWQGIRFDNIASSNDSSRISYCSVTYGVLLAANGAGISVNNFSKLSITNSSITNCTANQGFGGGIYMSSSNAMVSDNNISFNHSLAGGIYINNGSPLINSNYISYNDNVLPPGGPGDPGSDPDNWGGGISCNNSTATISNNTITNNSSSNGGGISSSFGSVTISKNNISNNYSVSMGGGIYQQYGTLILTDNNISNNSSDNIGGGVYFEMSNGEMNRNVISNNKTLNSGGGIFFSGASDFTIKNNSFCNNAVTGPITPNEGGGAIKFIGGSFLTKVFNNIFSNNSASMGGAIFFSNGSPALSSNTITNNSAMRGGAMYCLDSRPAILNSLLWGNTASVEGPQVFLEGQASHPDFTFSNIQGGKAVFATTGFLYSGIYQNNIDADPLFESPSLGSGIDFNGNLANWSLQNNSPAVNTGNPAGSYPAEDFVNNYRVISGIIDMGALENQTGIPPTAIISGGGQSCTGAQRPAVVVTFTYGTFPFTLQYRLNGVSQTPVANINSLQYTINNPQPGTYTIDSITDLVTTGSGSGSATVTVVNVTAGYTTNNSKQCLQGNSFMFSNTSSTNVGGLLYYWNFGDGSPEDTSTYIQHTYATAGIYKVRLIALGTGGCSDTAETSVTITNFTINPLQDSLKVYQDSVILNAGAGYANYNWNTGETKQSITVNQTGWYKVTVINNDGCSAKDSSFITFIKKKTLFLDKVQSICSPSFNISVSTKNISNVVGLQGTISWDKSLFTFNSIIYDASAINITPADINLNNVSSGYITFSWNDNSLAGKSTTDSTKIFSIRFDKGNIINAVTSPITFNSFHTALEIDTINLSTGTPAIATDTAFINGSAGFNAQAATMFIPMAGCDSIIYKGKAYYTSTLVLDTIKYFNGVCDSVHKIVDITVYSQVDPTVNISVNQNNILYGSTVTFTAHTAYGGQSPVFKWFKNGVVINGQSASTYSSSVLNANDTIHVNLKSSISCAMPDSSNSNKIGMRVNYTVSGQLKNSIGIAIPNATVNITGHSTSSLSPGVPGTYSTSLSGGYNYVIKPNKNNDLAKTNGVSTLDVALIQSHILHSSLLNSPYKLIAADVTNNGEVTALDIIYIKRLILGLDITFPGNKLWAFADTSSDNFDPFHPLQYKESISLTGLLANKTNQNFIGVKLGDVNFDWNATVFRPQQPTTEPITFYFKDVIATEGVEIKVPVKVKNFKNVLGMQFTLNFNSDVLELKRIEKNRLNVQYATNKNNEGKLPFIWNDGANKLSNLVDDEVLMELIFVQKAAFNEEDIRVTSDIAEVEAWDGLYNKHTIVKGPGKIIQQKNNSVYTTDSWKVTPNLTQGIINVNVQLTKAKKVHFDLLNAEGKIVMSQSAQLPAGISDTRFDLQRDQRLAAGIYYLKASGIEGNGIRKIILIR